MISIFLFYNISTGIQSKLAFSKIFRHCNIITYDGEQWINFELDSLGVHACSIKVTKPEALIRGLKHIKELTAMITVETTKDFRHGWLPWWVRSCNEFDRYVSGVDIGFTFNPRHLFSKLIRYNMKRNYTILQVWRRDNGLLWRS